MKRIRCEAFQNDAGETFDAGPGEVAVGLGTDYDEAFLRGRKYRAKGYSLAQTKSAVKTKSPAFRKEVVRGWSFSRR